MKTRIKKLFLKREKTTHWSWVFRVGAILLIASVLLTLSAIVIAMVATNNQDLAIMGINAHKLTVVSGISACVSALTGMFFLFCGKVSDK